MYIYICIYIYVYIYICIHRTLTLSIQIRSFPWRHSPNSDISQAWVFTHRSSQPLRLAQISSLKAWYGGEQWSPNVPNTWGIPKGSQEVAIKPTTI